MCDKGLNESTLFKSPAYTAGVGYSKPRSLTELQAYPLLQMLGPTLGCSLILSVFF